MRYLVVEVFSGSSWRAYSLGGIEFEGFVSYDQMIRRLETAMSIESYGLGSHGGRFIDDARVWESTLRRTLSGNLYDIEWFYVHVIDGVLYRETPDGLFIYDGVDLDELEFY